MDITTDQGESQGLDTTRTDAPSIVSTLTAHAIAVLRGTATGHDEALSIIGSRNNYNSRGRGSTMAVRVLRSGAWVWVSRSASRGRMLASDRRDTQYGDVYEGEIVARYFLGRDGGLDTFGIVLGAEQSDGVKWIKIESNRIRTGYRLTLTDGTAIEVSDPTWRES